MALFSNDRYMKGETVLVKINRGISVTLLVSSRVELIAGEDKRKLWDLYYRILYICFVKILTATLKTMSCRISITLDQMQEEQVLKTVLITA